MTTKTLLLTLALCLVACSKPEKKPIIDPLPTPIQAVFTCDTSGLKPVLEVLRYGAYMQPACGEMQDSTGPGKSCDRYAIEEFKHTLNYFKGLKNPPDRATQRDLVGDYMHGLPVCYSDECKRLEAEVGRETMRHVKDVVVSPEEIRKLLGNRDFATLQDFYSVEVLAGTPLTVITDEYMTRNANTYQYEQQLGKRRRSCDFQRLEKLMPGVACLMNDCKTSMAVVRAVEQEPSQ